MNLHCVREGRLDEPGEPDVFRAGVPRQDDPLRAAVEPRPAEARRLPGLTSPPEFGGHLREGGGAFP